MSEATYSMPMSIDHTATIRQVGMMGDYVTVQAICPCGWTGPSYSGRIGWDSGSDACKYAERDAAAHRRGMG